MVGRPKKVPRKPRGRPKGCKQKPFSLTQVSPPVIPQSLRRSLRIAERQMEDRVLRNRKFYIKALRRMTPQCHARSHHGEGCASKILNHRSDYNYTGLMTERCDYCENMISKSEKYNGNLPYHKCCNNGMSHTKKLRQTYHELQNPPEEMLDLCDTNTINPDANEFLSKTRLYNASLAFGSLLCHSENQITAGPPVCRINGEFHFEVSDLKIPEGMTPKFGQLYMLDHAAAQEYRETSMVGSKCKARILDRLAQMINFHNPLAHAYKKAAEVIATLNEDQLEHFQMTIMDHRQLKPSEIDTAIHAHRVTKPGSDETIAYIWASDQGDERPNFAGVWLFNKKGKREFRSMTDPNLDPLLFPMLFPRGTQGYKIKEFKLNKNPTLSTSHSTNFADFTREAEYNADNDSTNFQYADDASSTNESTYSADNDTISISQVNACTTNDSQHFENHHSEIAVKSKRKKQVYVSDRQWLRYMTRVLEANKYHWLWSKRALSEVYLILAQTRIEKREMDFYKQQVQTDLRSALPQELIEGLKKGLKQGETLGKVWFAPKSWKGTRRYMQKAYADAMAIARTFDNPTWFITFTGNRNWPEIVNQLQPGQTSNQRADITCRVFFDKAKDFIRDLTEHHVMGEMKAWCYSVEHQKRGMPHLHFLGILKKVKVKKRLLSSINMSALKFPANTTTWRMPQI